MRVTGREPWVKAAAAKFRKLSGVKANAATIPGTAKRPKRPRRPKPPSEHEELLWLMLKQANLHTLFEREVYWHDIRKWRSDFGCRHLRILVEVDGATWASGRHNVGRGYEADRTKDNTAQLNGWLALRFSGDQVSRGEAIQTIIAAVNYAERRRVIASGQTQFCLECEKRAREKGA